jgi:hypothetical protein
MNRRHERNSDTFSKCKNKYDKSEGSPRVLVYLVHVGFPLLPHSFLTASRRQGFVAF